MESELEGVSDNIVGRASVQSIAVIEQRYFFTYHGKWTIFFF